MIRGASRRRSDVDEIACTGAIEGGNLTSSRIQTGNAAVCRSGDRQRKELVGTIVGGVVVEVISILYLGTEDIVGSARRV